MAGRMALVTRLAKVPVLQGARLLHHEAPDYYGILGVRKHADLKDIKFAYFNMAKKFHPDNNQTLDARQVFSLVAEAYDVLSDPDKRAKYDDTGLAEHKFGGTSSGPGRQASDSSYTAEQMYQTIFGAGVKEEDQEQVHTEFAATHSGTEATREYIAQVTAEEAVLGTDFVLQLRIVGQCDKCCGSRSELGYTGNVCPYCEGTGQETIRTGHITARKTCSYCHGEKIFIKYKCMECEGLGRKTYDTPYPVTIPPGTEHGEVIRLEIDPILLNMPDYGREIVGVLYVTVSVDRTDKFSVEGRDILMSLQLSPALALLGGQAFVSTPARDLRVKVEQGTSSHSAIVVAEEGVRTGVSLPGDLVIKTAIRVPTRLSWRQKKIFERFASLEQNVETEGLVEGVPSKTDHKLNVNVTSADKVANVVVVKPEVKRMDKTIEEMLRDKLGIHVPDPLGKPARPPSGPPPIVGS